MCSGASFEKGHFACLEQIFMNADIYSSVGSVHQECLLFFCRKFVDC